MSIVHDLYHGETRFPLIHQRRKFYAVSGLLVLIALLSMLLQGFNLGVEFKGGQIYTFPVTSSVDIGDARSFFGGQGLDEPIVQKIGTGTGGGTSLRIETRPVSAAENMKVLSAIESHYPTVDKDGANIDSSAVGSSWGSQVSRRALEGLVTFLIAVIIYISIRFEPRMAIAAIVALIHDLVLAAGIYSITQFVVTPSTIIALLTVLGYSLYDTIVVFDKVDENTRGIERGSVTTYSEAAELAVNQTFMRSINTSLIALLPVAGLLFVGAFLLGAGTLKDLSLALFVGLASGAYSSLFLATPLLADLKEREPRFATLRARVESKRSATTPVGVGVPAGATAVSVAVGPGGFASAPPARAARPAGSTSAKKRKKGSRPGGRR